MKYLTLLLLISLAYCDSPNDPRYYLSPDYLVGQWLRIKEIPSAIPGLYQKDTTTYRIGMDPLVTSDQTYNLKKPLAYKILYPRGGYVQGYISNPIESYDYDRDMSSLLYDYVADVLVGGKSQIQFEMPVADSLFVLIGSVTSPTETFGLRRQ